eukprot:TRINITY_DN27286_c0_g1_i1.p1 TRINITY_DN27286_c0_g1~~TRINITY_DN27286_c0_g1_i1.p1  ORF type:complete len:452 (-),score=62.57 TRINITY_DN27286_c0_g1_i1:51-1406(-)
MSTARGYGAVRDLEKDDLKTEEGRPEMAALWRREFTVMSWTFGVNSAMVTTAIFYASSVLTDSAGQAGNAMLYGATMVCSLFLAAPMFGALGAKRGLTFGMALYAIYVALFAASANMCTEMDEDSNACIKSTSQQLPTALFGSLMGGIGAGVLWTSQGSFFSYTCERVAKAEKKDLPTVTNELASYFAVIYLATEAAFKGFASLMTQHTSMGYPELFYAMAAMAVASMLAFTALASSAGRMPPSGSPCDKTLSAVRLWTDPKLWLLQFTNLTFGLAGAYLAGYVNRDILSQALSSDVIGFAGAMQSGLSSLLSGSFGIVSRHFGKTPVVVFGSISAVLLGVLSQVGNPDTWGWGVLIFYLFGSVVRAVYECTNKAIFADFFPGEKSVGAFANVFVFCTGSSAAAYVLGATGKDMAELYLMLAFALLAVPGYYLASALRSGEADGSNRISKM